jgi:hypothetical protein
MSEWQDISTAPTGRLLLVCDRHDIRKIASLDRNGVWMADNNDLLDEPPLVWMELQDPPAKRDRSENAS